MNLSKREQAKRFLKRIDHPEKNWKFSPSDVRERGYWDDYQRAFEAMLSQTSTKWAPWYVVPANHKWFSRLATAAVLVTALDAINPGYPVPDPAVRDQMAQVREELAAELGMGSRPSGGCGLCRARTRTLPLSSCFPGSLRCPRVLADQAVEDLPALDPAGHVDRLIGFVQRRRLLPRLMGPMLVVMPRVLGQDLPEVSFTVDQQVVEALAP